MDLLAELNRTHGLLPPRAGAGRSVRATTDLVRVRDSARRVWQNDPDLPILVGLLTRSLRHTDTPCVDPDACEGCKARALKPAQAQFLRELHDGGAGAVGTLRVGAGKTLVSLLAPTVVRAVKPLLIVPANCVEKTRRAAAQYARHWRVPSIEIISYEFLSSPKQLRWLETFAPDLIIADECQRLKDAGTKAAKRISKYLKAVFNANMPCRFVPLSGSIAGRSIREHWHYVRWALRSRAPVPNDPIEAQSWALAMDEKISPEMRFDPGALLSLAATDPNDTPLVQARKAYQERFTSTPGIVSTLEEIPPTNLRLWSSELTLPPAAVAAIQLMRQTWQTPAGEDFSLALDLWRHARTLGIGLFYRWDPPAPLEWMAARRAWHKYVREALKHSRTMDSVVHLVEKIKLGEANDGGIYAEWKDIEPSFDPNPVPVWVHDAMVIKCVEWLATHPRGVVWSAHPCFGERVAELAGVPYFGSEGVDARSGALIDAYSGTACVASIHACGTGHNLQHWWCDNLFPSPPSKGDHIEQALGRTHRDGQDADEVTGEFVITCQESATSLAQALRDAKFMHHTLGQPQKLCYGENDFGTVARMAYAPEEEHEIGI